MEEDAPIVSVVAKAREAFGGKRSVSRDSLGKPRNPFQTSSTATPTPAPLTRKPSSESSTIAKMKALFESHQAALATDGSSGYLTQDSISKAASRRTSTDAAKMSRATSSSALQPSAANTPTTAPAIGVDPDAHYKSPMSRQRSSQFADVPEDQALDDRPAGTSRALSRVASRDEDVQATSTTDDVDALTTKQDKLTVDDIVPGNAEDPFGHVVMRFKRNKGVVDEETLTSRRGTVVGTVGAVQARRNQFAIKADKNQPKSVAEQLAESEEAAGALSGGKIVVYTTSVSTVKSTYQACQDMRKILQRARVAFEERDIFLDASFNKELVARLPDAVVPYVFFNGQPLGDYEVVHKLNENDVLRSLFADMPKIKDLDTGECGQCGSRGFITCTWCGGGKKSISNRFGRSIVSLKCTACNENGLMRCTACLSTDQSSA